MEAGLRRFLVSFMPLALYLSYIVYTGKNVPKPRTSGCSLLPHSHYWIASKHIVTPHEIISGAVEINGGRIISLVKEKDWQETVKNKPVIDYGNAVVMPGLIDVHAHLDDPGRTEWEGFPSGTKAAAAGGITTLIDMPLNSHPSTVSKETLQLKINAAKGRIFVNVGFWGGLVPENAFNASILESLLDAGALGLKIPAISRSIVVMDDIFCIFNGYLQNTCVLRRSYGLSKQANEAMIVVEAYKVLRDRAPYPADQVIKELDGKFSFVLFDAKATKLFIARDRDGSAQLHWGVAADGCLVCSDDPEIVKYGCGNRYTPFPPGCLFQSEEGLISFDHPLNKVRGVVREDDEGYSTAVIFQVDLFTRLYSIPRSGSDANWLGVTVVESES
ncbi:allantoinase [Artemisia annua]|uniref:Allantoinase n=1 Tax=Artemisia annua TaxID=35608 RepID=A0A2U1KUD3_ARTAN|nr:allantoinase [Artemisia annua]